MNYHPSIFSFLSNSYTTNKIKLKELSCTNAEAKQIAMDKENTSLKKAIVELIKKYVETNFNRNAQLICVVVDLLIILEKNGFGNTKELVDKMLSNETYDVEEIKFLLNKI